MSKSRKPLPGPEELSLNEFAKYIDDIEKGLWKIEPCNFKTFLYFFDRLSYTISQLPIAELIIPELNNKIFNFAVSSTTQKMYVTFFTSQLKDKTIGEDKVINDYIDSEDYTSLGQYAKDNIFDNGSDMLIKNFDSVFKYSTDHSYVNRCKINEVKRDFSFKCLYHNDAKYREKIEGKIENGLIKNVIAHLELYNSSKISKEEKNLAEQLLKNISLINNTQDLTAATKLIQICSLIVTTYNQIQHSKPEPNFISNLFGSKPSPTPFQERLCKALKEFGGIELSYIASTGNKHSGSIKIAYSNHLNVIANYNPNF
jgi:hypothetical protein